MNIKIAVPWPHKEDSQPRIQESLSLWENKDDLLVCSVESTKIDLFLKSYHTTTLARNSTDIGTLVPKCYIYDMVKATRDQFPDCKWFGFGNSDCVPVGDLVEEENLDYEALIYHRTEIPSWKNRFRIITEKPIPTKLIKQIWKWRSGGESDKRICRSLNRMEAPTPHGEPEWTYPLLKKLFLDQGTVFFWGQDMYLFRADIVDRVLEEYLKVRDPILGTGGFDPRLSKWLINNFNSARVIHKIFHKMHPSEWGVDEIEYSHNGGDIGISDRVDYFEDTFLMSLCDEGQRGAIPKYIKYLVGQKNPELYDVLIVEK